MSQPIFQKGQKVSVLVKGAFDYELQIWVCDSVREETGECLLMSPDKVKVVVVNPDGTLSNEDVTLADDTTSPAGLTAAESEEFEELLSMFMDDQPMTPEQVERLNKLEMQVLNSGMY